VKRLPLGLFAAAASAALLPAAAARAADDTAQLQARLDGLKAQVKQLQAAKADGPTYNAKDVDAAVTSVLTDADRRSQLLAEAGGFVGGWSENGFGLASADGNYSLYTGIGFQFRSVTNLGDFGDDDSTVDDGFEIRRLKFAFSGNAISKNLTYNFRWAVDRGTGTPVLEEAWARYKFADQLSFRVGQIKTSIDQETGIPYTAQLAVDRSFLNEVLVGGENYTQGVELIYEGDVVRANVAYTDGSFSRNTTFRDAGANFGVDARAVFKAFGDWKDTTAFTALNSKSPLLLIGAGENYTQSGDSDVLRYSVDALFKTGPVSLYGAYVGRLTTAGDDGDDTHDWGFVVQGGYVLSKNVELFARYDMVKFENDQANGEDTVHEITAGVNYYFKGHAAKVTIDAVWLPSGSPISATTIGVIGQTDDDDQFLIRGQFQLML
jgi:hypothetical protein